MGISARPALTDTCPWQPVSLSDTLPNAAHRGRFSVSVANGDGQSPQLDQSAAAHADSCDQYATCKRNSHSSRPAYVCLRSPVCCTCPCPELVSRQSSKRARSPMLPELPELGHVQKVAHMSSAQPPGALLLGRLRPQGRLGGLCGGQWLRPCRWR